MTTGQKPIANGRKSTGHWTTTHAALLNEKNNLFLMDKLFKHEFNEIVDLIKKSRIDALKSVNSELIRLYWRIGEYINAKVKRGDWGDSTVSKLADYIQNSHPELKGYTRRNLYRMKQFYEAYELDKKVSALLTQISWTNHLMILSKTKSKEEKEFYLNLSVKEKYSSRELERQIDSCFFERAMISKISPPVTKAAKNVAFAFKDTYILDFLDLKESHSEKDLRTALVKSFKNFVLEFGKDFTFAGEEYRIQVGNNDYFIDLLFYHRELKCLVAFELKIDEFKPEYLGKMNFYLEALDQDVKKSHENPSVGVILCKNKNKEVVEYALNRSLSPSLISEYRTKLIPKRLLENKMKEFLEINNNKYPLDSKK